MFFANSPADSETVHFVNFLRTGYRCLWADSPVSFDGKSLPDPLRNAISIENRNLSDRIEINLYTDGACSGNPGPGGWAYIIEHIPSGKVNENSGAVVETTNNRMELEAVVQGLLLLKRPCHVELFTDSVYVGKGMTQWMPKWKLQGWKRKEKNQMVPVKNEDLWVRLDKLTATHKVKYTRVAGHSGHPQNERCDELAVQAYQQYLSR